MATTIQVSDDTWKRLTKNKEKGRTFEKVIIKALNTQDALEREIRNSGRTSVIQISVLRRILENE